MPATVPTGAKPRPKKRARTGALIETRSREIAQVRSEADILSTLDENCTLDALSFMPEMRRYCGLRLPVLRRVDKVIIEGRSGLRRLRNAVILDGATCDGSAHGNCQYGCPLLWKEEWLHDSNTVVSSDEPRGREWCGANPSASGDGLYECQATSLFAASSPLPLWHIDRYLWDIRDGAFSPRILARTWLILSYNRARTRLGLKKRYLFHGRCKTTPSISLGLQPGELVRVKSRQEVEATLDSRGRNRGMGFTTEMLNCCGRTYRVLRPIERMIVESTAKMQKMTDTVLLEGVHCEGEAHFNCHRRCRPLWKEIWLERV